MIDDQVVPGKDLSAESIEIIQLLADGEFHSGEELGRLLGVSRAAVWKRLQLLQPLLGLHFESVRGQGYRLAGGIELLDGARVQAAMPPAVRSGLSRFEVHALIDSTNRRAAQLAQAGVDACTVIVAEQQTAGSGRRGRRWISPFGRNIYCSMLWAFDGGVAALEGLSLVVGLVVARIIAPLTDRHVQLKWPNDVLVDGRKIAGILLEVAGDVDGRCTVVIGVGLNVNMAGADETAGIEQAWCDVSSIARSPVSRNDLLTALIVQLVQALRIFEQKGFAAFREDWSSRDYLAGSEVSIESGGQCQYGTALGLDESGALLVEIDGVTRAIHGGEVSVRLQR